MRENCTCSDNRGLAATTWQFYSLIDQENNILESDDSNNTTTESLVKSSDFSVSEDEFEPNNDLASVKAIGLNRNYRVSFHSASDLDYYRAFVGDKASYIITLDVPLESHYEVNIYDSDENLVQTFSSNDGKEFDYQVSVTGIYTFEVKYLSGYLGRYYFQIGIKGH